MINTFYEKVIISAGLGNNQIRGMLLNGILTNLQLLLARSWTEVDTSGSGFIIQRKILMKILQEHKDVLGERLKYVHLLPFLSGWCMQNITALCSCLSHWPPYISCFSCSMPMKLCHQNLFFWTFLPRFLPPHSHDQPIT